MICALTTASPSGDSLAFVRNNQIHRQRLSDGELSYAKISGFNHAETKSLIWSQDSSQILVIADTGIKVVSSEDCTERAHLDNGSGGVGKIASADFIGNDAVLVAWEFGRSKIWNLLNGKSTDLLDFKTTCSGRIWQSRSRSEDAPSNVLATLSRNGVQDCVARYITQSVQQLPVIALPTTDAQSLAWSPDGKWLAILDVPTASSGLYIYTPEGHLFRSYAPLRELDNGLGVKQMTWSPDSRLLALTFYDGKVELLNTRTFSAITVMQHHLVIDQRPMHVDDQAPVWQEVVAASNDRSFALLTQPVSVPLTRPKQSPEPSELGVVELCFSCDGSYVATREGRMLNTVWIWSTTELSARAVIIQNSPVRRLSWHPTRRQTILIDCAEAIAYVFDVSASGPPVAYHSPQRSKATLSWIFSSANARSTILATEKTSYSLLHPEGQTAPGFHRPGFPTGHGDNEEGVSDDSLFDVLSGRKPLPPKTEPSYTEMVDLDMDAEDTIDGGLDDTFRAKRKLVPTTVEVDPLEDSEIF